MKEQWKTFLVKAGAEMDGNRVVHFGNPERELRVATTGCILSDLNHLGLISVHGADAEAFLQGQLTCDLRDVTRTSSRLGAHCSHKGRILTLFRLFKCKDDYYLQCPAELVEPAVVRLRKYILMSKVTVEDAADALVRIGYAGPTADAHIAELLGSPAAAEPDDAVQTADLLTVRLAGAQPRFELAGSLEAVTRAWTTLDVHGAPVGADVWSLLDIQAGVPMIFPETVEAFVPQMVNLQAMQGVSFIKGCYTGQEVVARSEYLGKLKRRMYLAHVDGNVRPEAGAELFSSGSQSGQGPGKVVDARPVAHGGFELLAVVETAAVERNDVRMWDESGPALEFRQLPYSLPEKA